MKFTQIRIKNYRSIIDEVNITFGGKITIIGPNNSGKTNIINAIDAFFSGMDHNTYELKRDLPVNLDIGQTSIIASFVMEEAVDAEFIATYLEMQNLLETQRNQDLRFQLFLYYSRSGKPVYQFFPNAKIKNKSLHRFRSIHEKAVRQILNLFSCKIISSAKNSENLFSEILLPYIRKSVALVLEPHIVKINNQLDNISASINSALDIGNLGKIKAAFDISGSLENTLSKFDFYIDDGIKMRAEAKGSGVQAAVLLSSLKWIGTEEKKLFRETIWLLEEPESYLHPDLEKSCVIILDDLSTINPVVVTTHALSFIGTNPDHIYETGFENSRTLVKQCRTYSEATASIRKSLGLKYSDFFQLGTSNLFVEGQSDREIISWALSKVKPHKGKNELPILRKSTIIDFTGVSSLRDFLKHSYNFVRSEVATFTVFDGDSAGLDTANSLNGFFSNKSIPFRVNKDYCILPKGFPIEGLFPEIFIKEIYESNPNWFQSLNVDIHNNLLTFTIKDGSKGSVQKALMRRADVETEKTGNYAWAKEFITLFEIAERELSSKISELYPMKALHA